MNKIMVYISIIVFCILFWVVVFCLLSNCSLAEEYTDEQIVKAIHKAEGGNNAQYPYGIRSIPCRTECYAICKNTVRNNRRRFKEYGYKSYPDFISFLGSRYCPTKGRSLSKAERELNGNWVRNVRYILKGGV